MRRRLPGIRRSDRGLFSPLRIGGCVGWWRADRGITLAGQPTLTQTSSFDHTDWTKTNTTVNADQAIGGQTTCDQVVETAVDAVHTVAQTPGNIGTQSATYTIDAHAGSLAAARTWIYLQGNGGGSRVWFDLQNGVVGTQTAATGTITALGSGWYRCSMTFTYASGGYTCGLATADGVSSYLGDVTADAYLMNAAVSQVNTRVSAWADQSGNGNHLSQSSAVSQPLYSAGTFGPAPGRDALVFDGTNDYLIGDSLGALIAGADVPVTVVVACTPTALGALRAVVSWGDSTSATNSRHLLYHAATDVLAAQKTDSGGSSATAGHGAITSSAYRSAWVHTGTMCDNYLNKAAVDSDALNVGVMAPDLFSVGVLRRSVLSSYLHGTIAELVIYDRALLANEVRRLLGYMGNRYGIA